MTIESTNDKLPTAPAITYSECYVQPFFSFYNADNMAIMKTFKDKEFDLAIVDPPYGIGEQGGKCRTRKKHNNKVKHEKKNWDNETPTKEYFNELFRISKNQIIWGANYFTEHLPKSMGWIYWDKKIGGDYSDGELAFTSYQKALKSFTKWNGNNGEARIHPTQKPVQLYEFCLQFANIENGAKIIDTNLGSGSIAIAIDKANTLDKKNLTFVGIELDPDYFQAAVERFKNHKRQCVLF